MDFNLGKILEKYMAKYPCCIIKINENYMIKSNLRTIDLKSRTNLWSRKVLATYTDKCNQPSKVW